MATVLCIGQAVQDFVFGVGTLPRRPEKHRAGSFTSVGGGPAATAAVTIARLGGRAVLAARLGEDDIAGLIEAELVSYGVDCRYLRRFGGCRSSVSAVLVDAAGERLLVNYLDPELPAAGDWLPDPAALGAAAVLADPRWVEGGVHGLQRGRAAGLPAILDADQQITLDSPLLAAATHAAFSAEALAECMGEAEPGPALARVAAARGGWTGVTLGSGGFLACAAGEQTQMPAFQVPVVDTLGAGDVWHGAFALALAEGQAEPEAVRFANAAAAVKVQRPGGRLGVPTRGEVDALLARHGVDG